METFGPVAAPQAARKLYQREPALAPGSAPTNPAAEPASELPAGTAPPSREEISAVVSAVLEDFGYANDPPGADSWGLWRVRVLQGLFGQVTRKFGDCDDFVVEIKRRLLALGMTHAALRLMRCRTETLQPHLVLAILQGPGEPLLVADQRRGLCEEGDPRLTGYRWKDRENGSSATTWERLERSTPQTLADLLGLGGGGPA